MKRIISKLLVGSLITASMSIPAQATYAESIAKAEQAVTSYQDVEFVPGHVIVALKDSADDCVLDVANQTKSFEGVKVKNIESLGMPQTGDICSQNTSDNLLLLTLESSKKADVLNAVEDLNKDSSVKYAEPDYISTIDEKVPSDPYYSKQYGFSKIEAPLAWEKIRSVKKTVVGVIDTGIDYNHPDLANNMWKNPGEIPGDGVDNDHNGYIDDVYGWDFVNNDCAPLDDHSHGTHVAGIIAASSNNGVGVAGVSWSSKLVALKIGDANGRMATSNAIKAINYANAMGIKITNNSWGGGAYSQALYDTIAAQSGLFIAAAGNDANNNDNNNFYPASYNLDQIISVAATTQSDTLASFSNYGKNTVDLAAPGSSIYSTLPGGIYGNKSGTSMATPFVTGAVALYCGYNSKASYQQVKNVLLNSVDKVDCLSDKVVSGGRLNLNHLIGKMRFYNGTDYSDVYNYSYYINKYADLKQTFGSDDISVFQHFINNGMSEGRQAKKEFNVNIYKKNYQDLRNVFGNNLPLYYEHYINYGKAENRTGYNVLFSGTSRYQGVDYSPVYNYTYYINRHGDVKDMFGADDAATISHFVLNGMSEARQASEEFDVQAYRRYNEDLDKAFGDDWKSYYLHYINYGKKEGRRAK